MEAAISQRADPVWNRSEPWVVRGQLSKSKSRARLLQRDETNVQRLVVRGQLIKDSPTLLVHKTWRLVPIIHCGPRLLSG